MASWPTQKLNAGLRAFGLKVCSAIAFYLLMAALTTSVQAQTNGTASDIPGADKLGLPAGKSPNQNPSQGILTTNAQPAATNYSDQHPNLFTNPPPQALRKVLKETHNEISIPATFSDENGNIILPFGNSLKETPNGIKLKLSPTSGSPNGQEDFFGVTLSHSFNQEWYTDFAYSHGSMSGDFTTLLPSSLAGFQQFFNLKGNFDLSDDWYQLYVRYFIPQTRGHRVLVYLRAGASYIDTTLNINGAQSGSRSFPSSYILKDDFQDLRGNLGYGVAMPITFIDLGSHFRFLLLQEGEGFYGERFQSISENLTFGGGYARLDMNGPKVPVDNSLYGGLGRLTFRSQYNFGQGGLFSLFCDAGIEVRYTRIEYSNLGTFGELLWGPYIRVGARYSF
jgi:hypothetical protein